MQIRLVIQMSKNLTPVRKAEVLPAFTNKDAERIEAEAVKHYQLGQRYAMLFAAELRRLQRGSAHLLRGYSSFGPYAESVFEGMTASNAVQISRTGEILLILEESNRINLKDKDCKLPGTTGLRALAVMYKQFGQAVMLSIYDKAVASGRPLVEDTVKAAAQELLAPIANEPQELGPGAEEEEDPEEEDEEDKLPKKVQELIDHIRDLSYDLPNSIAELQETMDRLKAELDGENWAEDEKWIKSKR
jgi:hypothetical protein